MKGSIRALLRIWICWFKGHRKFLYIPYEILQRELHGNIILAATAHQSGFVTLLGQKASIFPIIPFLPRGTVFLKSIVPGEVKLQRAMRACGHFNVSLDVEGLTMSNGLAGVSLRYSETSVNLADKLFFWGDAQLHRILEAIPAAKDKSVTTGSPAADWWGASAASVQKKKAPKTILFATSFPIVNHPLGDAYYNESLKAAAPEALVEQGDEFALDAALQAAALPAYKSLLAALIEHFQDARIWLRPHPTEVSQVWEKIVAEATNVEMATIQDIGFYLNEADAFIHFNSTAAIQAAIQGVPAINLLPAEVSVEMRARMSEPISAVTQEFNEVSDVIDAVSRTLGDQPGVKEADVASISMFLDFTPGQIDHSARRIIKEIDALETPSPKQKRGTVGQWSQAVTQLTVRPVLINMLRQLSLVLPRQTPGLRRWRKSAEYGRMKGSEIRKRDIRHIMEMIVSNNNNPTVTANFQLIRGKIVIVD